MEQKKKWLVGMVAGWLDATVVLGRDFVEQGFPKVMQRHVRGYLVVRRSAEEMMALRRMTARESMKEQVTDGTDVF